MQPALQNRNKFDSVMEESLTKTTMSEQPERSFMEIKNDIVMVLQTIYDPEIPVNIYELGLIYDVTVNPDNTVKLDMTLTAPNCPVAEILPQEVQEKVMGVRGVKDVDLHLTFDPPWTMDMMSEAAKLELGML